MVQLVGVFVGVLVIIIIAALIRARGKKWKWRKGKYEHAPRDLDTPANFDAATAETQRAGGGPTAVGRNGSNRTGQVTRETSIRSILTLPAYQNKPNEGERVLGREGERDGVDVVVEFPTAEEQEAMREEEMEAMYQVRVARRQQVAERDELRRQRAEARQRGDNVALAELRAQARAITRDNTVVSELRESHQQAKTRRQRAVSSVSYHDLGVARHDGTRIRVSSDSERIGLLSDAASINAPSTRAPSSLNTHHLRQHSTSSVVSLDSDAGNGIGNGNGAPSPALPRSGAATPQPSTANSHTFAGSSPEIIVEADLGDTSMPRPDPHSPPDYEELSLEDARSGATTPVFINEPPPNYPGGPVAVSSSAWSESEGPRDYDDGERERRLSFRDADMVDRMDDGGDLSGGGGGTTAAAGGQRRNSNGRSPDLDRRRSNSSVHSLLRGGSGSGGIPRLPSLRIGNLPQIVIEPEDGTGYSERR